MKSPSAKYIQACQWSYSVVPLALHVAVLTAVISSNGVLSQSGHVEDSAAVMTAPSSAKKADSKDTATTTAPISIAATPSISAQTAEVQPEHPVSEGKIASNSTELAQPAEPVPQGKSANTTSESAPATEKVSQTDPAKADSNASDAATSFQSMSQHKDAMASPEEQSSATTTRAPHDDMQPLPQHLDEKNASVPSDSVTNATQPTITGPTIEVSGEHPVEGKAPSETQVATPLPATSPSKVSSDDLKNGLKATDEADSDALKNSLQATDESFKLDEAPDPTEKTGTSEGHPAILADREEDSDPPTAIDKEGEEEDHLMGAAMDESEESADNDDNDASDTNKEREDVPQRELEKQYERLKHETEVPENRDTEQAVLATAASEDAMWLEGEAEVERIVEVQPQVEARPSLSTLALRGTTAAGEKALLAFRKAHQWHKEHNEQIRLPVGGAALLSFACMLIFLACRCHAPKKNADGKEELGFDLECAAARAEPVKACNTQKEIEVSHRPEPSAKPVAELVVDPSEAAGDGWGDMDDGWDNDDWDFNDDSWGDFSAQESVSVSDACSVVNPPVAPVKPKPVKGKAD